MRNVNCSDDDAATSRKGDCREEDFDLAPREMHVIFETGVASQLLIETGLARRELHLPIRTVLDQDGHDRDTVSCYFESEPGALTDRNHVNSDWLLFLLLSAKERSDCTHYDRGVHRPPGSSLSTLAFP